jgi:hypothetical protein
VKIIPTIIIFSAYLIRFVHLHQLQFYTVFIGTRIVCILGLVFDIL